jgi:vacuolar-type H+-ATPase subunit I/STV1
MESDDDEKPVSLIAGGPRLPKQPFLPVADDDYECPFDSSLTETAVDDVTVSESAERFERPKFKQRSKRVPLGTVSEQTKQSQPTKQQLESSSAKLGSVSEQTKQQLGSVSEQQPQGLLATFAPTGEQGVTHKEPLRSIPTSPQSQDASELFEAVVKAVADYVIQQRSERIHVRRGYSFTTALEQRLELSRYLVEDATEEALKRGLIIAKGAWFYAPDEPNGRLQSKMLSTNDVVASLDKLIQQYEQKIATLRAARKVIVDDEVT